MAAKIDPEKYQRIITASLKQFTENGYQKASTDVIANEADVSKGLIFHYFGKKQFLYEKTVSYVIDFLNDQSKQLFARSYIDLVELVTIATQHKLTLEQNYPEYMQFLIAAYAQKTLLPKAVEEKLEHYMTENMLAANRLFTEIIEQMPIRDGLKKAEVIQLVIGVFNQIQMESLAFLKSHPEASKLKQLERLTARAEMSMDILENGFLSSNE